VAVDVEDLVAIALGTGDDLDGDAATGLAVERELVVQLGIEVRTGRAAGAGGEVQVLAKLFAVLGLAELAVEREVRADIDLGPAERRAGVTDGVIGGGATSSKTHQPEGHQRTKHGRRHDLQARGRRGRECLRRQPSISRGDTAINNPAEPLRLGARMPFWQAPNA
jgi:hypothetical protein